METRTVKYLCKDGVLEIEYPVSILDLYGWKRDKPQTVYRSLYTVVGLIKIVKGVVESIDITGEREDTMFARLIMKLDSDTLFK